MMLKPGFIDEYIRRHDAIWPELTKLLIGSGIRDYSIFYDHETNILFGVQYLEGNNSSQDLGQNPLVQKWWGFMADIMETNPDNSPVSINMTKVFHMD